MCFACLIQFWDDAAGKWPRRLDDGQHSAKIKRRSELLKSARPKLEAFFFFFPHHPPTPHPRVSEQMRLCFDSNRISIIPSIILGGPFHYLPAVWLYFGTRPSGEATEGFHQSPFSMFAELSSGHMTENVLKTLVDFTSASLRSKIRTPKRLSHHGGISTTRFEKSRANIWSTVKWEHYKHICSKWENNVTLKGGGIRKECKRPKIMSHCEEIKKKKISSNSNSAGIKSSYEAVVRGANFLRKKL